jgi:hypothetical protein
MEEIIALMKLPKRDFIAAVVKYRDDITYDEAEAIFNMCSDEELWPRLLTILMLNQIQT